MVRIFLLKTLVLLYEIPLDWRELLSLEEVSISHASKHVL